MSTPASPSAAIRRAHPGDAAALSVFARRVFEDTFSADNDPADMAAYLDSAFSPERQSQEIAHVSRVVLLAESAGELVAYASVCNAVPNACAGGMHPVELERFYVDRAWHGRGIAARLMQEVLTQATAWGGDVLWLGVWERNPRAIQFYRKQGFNDVGAATFRLGSDIQNDRVMARQL
jgi:diamine N-acetyltransferase